MEAILGRPTFIIGTRLVYVRDTREKTSPVDLSEFRARYPDMNEKEFQDNFGFYDRSVYIDARFVDSKLNFLAVSKSETY